MTAPPATSRTTPVIHPASSDARNTAARATSCGVPSRPPGMGSTGGRRGDRDDVARFALLHPGEDAFDRQERRREIAVHRRPPCFLADVLERPGFGKAAARGH